MHTSDRRAAAARRPQLVSFAVAAVLAATRASAADEPQDIGEVTITGTRIQQTSGMTTPTPVAALSAVDLTSMAPTTITEAMTQLPQFYASATAENFNGANNGFFASPGGGSLNLRGIGSKRTLTLLDGRRVVSSSIYGGPDINQFPSAVLKTVETVTGGASALYGTDAVSGVVNFILDREFTGLRATAQTGQTDRGDGANTLYSLAFGAPLGSRAHVLFSLEHAEQDPISTYADRDWLQGIGLVQNGTGADAAHPRNVIASRITSINSSYDGVITAWQALPGNTVPASFTRSTFGADGSVSPFILGSPVSTVTGAQSTVNGGSGTNNATDQPSFLPSQDRTTAFGFVSLDPTDSLQLYVQAIWSDQTLDAENSPGLFDAGTNQPITIFANNAFLPADLKARMAANNIASFTLGRIGHSSDIGFDSRAQQATRTVSGTVGFNWTLGSGGFLSDWKVNGYYQYGDTDVDAEQSGIRIDRLFLATDAVTDPATGRTVCNVTLVSGRFPDCAPLNLFGRGNASQQAIDWVTGFDVGVPVTVTPYLPGYAPSTYHYISDGNKHRLIDIKQRVFEVSAEGKLFDGWAGEIRTAFGAHYRKEDLDQQVQAAQGNPAADPFVYPVTCNDTDAAAAVLSAACAYQVNSGLRPRTAIGARGAPGGAVNNTVEFQFSKVPFARGGYDIKELFGETLVPLVSGLPWLKQLNFNGALRWADYAGSGSIWTYKAGLDSAFTDEIRLRGTYSRDVRAANLGERFDRTGGFASVTDPRKPAGSPNVNITIVSGGNPDVQPETADTYTAGIVYRPHWLDGFDISVDWLSVSLKDSIESFAAQQIVNLCYQQNDQDQCANVQLNPDGSLFIVNQTFQNVSKAAISGIDVEMGYTRPITLFGGGERITTRLFASWLDENSTTNSAGVKVDRAGQVGNLFSLPDLKVSANVAYDKGPFRAYVQGRFIDSGNFDNLNGIGTNNWLVSPADNKIGSAFYLDTQLSYRVPAGDGSVEIFLNGTNVLDRSPPLVPSYASFGAVPGQYNSALYDILGRRYVLGLRAKF